MPRGFEHPELLADLAPFELPTPSLLVLRQQIPCTSGGAFVIARQLDELGLAGGTAAILSGSGASESRSCFLQPPFRRFDVRRTSRSARDLESGPDAAAPADCARLRRRRHTASRGAAGALPLRPFLEAAMVRFIRRDRDARFQAELETRSCARASLQLLSRRQTFGTFCFGPLCRGGGRTGDRWNHLRFGDQPLEIFPRSLILTDRSASACICIWMFFGSPACLLLSCEGSSPACCCR